MTAAADNKARERKTGDSRHCMLPFTDTRELAEEFRRIVGEHKVCLTFDIDCYDVGEITALAE